jgi:hypothetical protein
LKEGEATAAKAFFADSPVQVGSGLLLQEQTEALVIILELHNLVNVKRFLANECTKHGEVQVAADSVAERVSELLTACVLFDTIYSHILPEVSRKVPGIVSRVHDELMNSDCTKEKNQEESRSMRRMNRFRKDACGWDRNV